MCRSQETKHTYSGCKLQDEEEDGSPTVWASFMHRISRVTQRDSKAEPGGESVEVKPDFHVVTITSIIQCLDAVNDPTQHQIPVEKRQCPNLTPWSPGDVAPVKGVGETEHIDECPVCQAAEKAIIEASNQNEVVGIALPSEGHFLTIADNSADATSTSSKYLRSIKDVANGLVARVAAREAPWRKK
jgi:hypothetical protein